MTPSNLYPQPNGLNKKLVHNVVLFILTCSIYACSGDATVSDQSSSAVIEGTVLSSNDNLEDIQTSKVFLDTNQNFQLDDNETVVTAKAGTGEFTLAIPALTAGQLNQSYLVAQNSSSTADNYLAAPLSAYVTPNAEGGYTTKKAVISPLTSLLAGEMVLNSLDLANASENVLAITNNTDLLSNYALQTPSTQTSQAQQIAQIIMRDWEPVEKDATGFTSVDNFKNNTVISKYNLSESEFNSKDETETAQSNIKPIDEASSTPGELVSTNGSKGYIVVYKNPTAPSEKKIFGANTTNTPNTLRMSAQMVQMKAQALAHNSGGKISNIYSRALSGFAVQVPKNNIQKFLSDAKNDPTIDYVEENKPVYLDAVTTQSNVPWGLDRIDQAKLPLNKQYSYAYDGSGVNAYVIDTGLNSMHDDFTGRVGEGFSVAADDLGTKDCKGHGTHVAGIIGGTTSGVAKKVKITPIRIFDCEGSSSISGIVAGIDWIIENGQLPAVVNMSIGISVNRTIDDAVIRLVDEGYVAVASAGNFAGSACHQSPARVHKVIAVAASYIQDNQDISAYFTNYGKCVDLFAPGAGILSAWFSDNNAYKYLNGTSMSAPHVAGVAALYLQMYPKATPLEIRHALYNSAKNNVISNPGAETPNRLLNIASQLNFTPVEKPLYIPPLNPPLPPIPPEDPKPPKPTIGFRIAAIDKMTATKKWLSKTKTTWSVNTEITIYASNKGPLQNAVITASYSVGGAQLSCTTNTAGKCTISSQAIAKSKTSTTITVNSVAGENLGYLAKINRVKSLAIKRP